jgi:hypothetical protein
MSHTVIHIRNVKTCAVGIVLKATLVLCAGLLYGHQCPLTMCCVGQTERRRFARVAHYLVHSSHDEG